MKDQPRPGDTLLVFRDIHRHGVPTANRLRRLLKYALRVCDLSTVACRDAKYGLEPARNDHGCTGAGCEACAMSE